MPMTESPNACIGGSVAIENPCKPYSENNLIDYINAITTVLPTGKKICLKPNNKNKSLFYATVGGEGITGIIVEVEFKPIKLKKRININLSFKPNDFTSLESFWNSIISLENDNLKIMRGVVFPLGLLQIRTTFEEQSAFIEFKEKFDHIVHSNKDIIEFRGEIPIGEMIIEQLAKEVNAKFSFFPAISNINYNDGKLNNLLVEYIKKEKTIGLIEEIEIGPMRKVDGSEHVFNGRIPDFTKIKKISGFNHDLLLLNYGGSNVGGGTHIAFLGNDLEKIKYHIEKYI